MTLAVWFWVLLVVSAIFGIWTGYTATPGQQGPYTIRHWGGSLLLYVLLAILGYGTFGGPIK